MIKEFKGGQAQEVAVHHGHAFQAPMLGIAGDEGIQLLLVEATPAPIPEIGGSRYP